MRHVRQQIRAHLAKRLTELPAWEMFVGMPNWQDNVHTSRVYPHDEAHLPALSIYTTADVAEDEQQVIGNAQMRTLTTHVEGRVKSTTNLDGTLDDMETEIIAAIYADRTLGGLVKDIVYRDTEIELSGESDKPVGMIRLTFTAWYRIDASDPKTVIA